jgi:nicotinamidase-related amidase
MEARMKDWMKLIPASEFATYKSAGFLTDMKLGVRPALIVIDMTYAFTGYEGQTLDESIESFGSACGPVSWEAMPKITRLIEMFRARDLPIVFTRANEDNTPFAGKATKSKRTKASPSDANSFPPPIIPRAGEWVLGKTRASAFFQTPLLSGLVQKGVDTLIFCGVSTSGCVRASVVDGFSNGFATFVVDECCFDRSQFAHAANLFDMDAKYASVVSLDDMAKLMAPFKESKAA